MDLLLGVEGGWEEGGGWGGVSFAPSFYTRELLSVYVLHYVY